MRGLIWLPHFTTLLMVDDNDDDEEDDDYVRKFKMN